MAGPETIIDCPGPNHVLIVEPHLYI